MSALSRALQTYRPNERAYLTELNSIRWEINFLLDFIAESPSNRSLSPMVDVLREKETLIKKALRESDLPPLPDELRNPYTRPRTPAEKEYIKALIKRHDKKRRKSVPTD